MQGLVVDATSGRPLSSVSVELIGPERTVTVSTGEDGRYEASGLEPGKYRVSARLAGYAIAHYGQRGQYDIGVLAEVRGGQITSGVDLKMQATGIVTGRIFDEKGDGLARVEVELVANRNLPGDRRAGAVGFAQTVEGGEFEFKEVLPGEYWVRAYLGQPLGDPQRAAQELRARLSELRGAVEGHQGFRSTFYPGVAHLEEAQSLRIDAGQALYGIDFALVKAPTHRVAGRALDETGQPATGVEVGLHSMAADGAAGQYSVRVDRDGRFDIRDVGAGTYMMMVSDRLSPWRWTSAIHQITIEDEDVIDVELRARIGAHVDGRVLRESGVTRTLDPNGIRVMFQRRVSTGGMFTGGGRPVGADGTFSFESPAGPVSIDVIGVPRGWMVRRVLVDEMEIGDRAIDMGEGGRRRVDVLLTDRVTQLLGQVTDAKGRAVMGADVLVYAEDAPTWTPGTRSMKQVRADAFGRFQIEGLPPGDYLAAAIDQPVPYALEEIDFLQRLNGSATRVRIAEGERRAITLRLTPLSSSR
jgi:5-hydroxyisourate hydrolase-like protein (transthyretin family)